MEKLPRAWVLPGGRPAVVLGRSQHGLHVASALPVRRRASGGGAVLTGPWLLRAAVRLPRGHFLLQQGPAALATWLGGIHLAWLQGRGLADARLHHGPTKEHWACFAGRSKGEVLVGERKITGIAQAWQRSGVLASAGTLLHPPPWSLLCGALGRPASDAVELTHATASIRQGMASSAEAQEWARSLLAVLAAALVRACAEDLRRAAGGP